MNTTLLSIVINSTLSVSAQAEIAEQLTQKESERSIKQSEQIWYPENTDLENTGVETAQWIAEAAADITKNPGKTDRLVVHAENTAKIPAGDALQAIKALPGIRIQSGSISMMGKQEVFIMIDGKIVRRSGESLVNFLESIDSETIKSIEIITTPSVKYEVPETVGLVNIQLKEARKNSWNAVLKSSYLQRYRELGSFGGDFNYNKDRINISVSANYKSGFRRHGQDDYQYFSEGLWYTHYPFVLDLKALDTRLNVGYKITPGWTMGAQYSYHRIRNLFVYAPYAEVSDYETNAVTRYLQSAEGRSNKLLKFHNVNYYNEIAIDTSGKKVTLNLDYFSYNRPDRKTHSGISVIENPFSQQYFAGINNNIQDVTNISGKLDVEYPVQWANLSFGGKISNLEAISDISYFNSELMDAPVTEFPLIENNFERTENAQSLYFTADKKINGKWQTKLGLRMEALQITAVSNILDTQHDYLKVFPTIHIAHTPNENSTLTASYSKSIENPFFYMLSPNVYFSNPFQGARGNHFLQPAFVDNVALTYRYKNLESKLYYNYEDNMYGQLVLPDPDTNFVDIVYENYMNAQRFGLTENYTFDTLSWWTSNNSVDVNYTILELKLPQEQERKGFNAIISTSNDFALNADKTLLFNLGYWYRFDGISGIFDSKAMSSLSLSLQALLLNKDLKITLTGSDIFRTETEVLTATVNGIYQEGRYYYDTQAFQLSVSYNFGNKNIKGGAHKTGNRRERSRSGY